MQKKDTVFKILLQKLEDLSDFQAFLYAENHILLSTCMIHYTCRHFGGLWLVVERVIMDCCSEKRQEER